MESMRHEILFEKSGDQTVTTVNIDEERMKNEIREEICLLDG